MSKKHKRMSKGMRALDTFGEVCFIFLAFLALAVCVGYGYYKYFVHDTVVGVNYVADQAPIDLVEKSDTLSADEIAELEDRMLFDVNYYSNDKGNGIELNEMKLNYFTDWTLSSTAMRSTGMQYVGDLNKFGYTKTVSSVEEAEKIVVPGFYHYDTTLGVTWSGYDLATQLNRANALKIKIDNRPFELQLTYTYKTGSWPFETIHFIVWANVFKIVIEAIKTNNYGYGDFYITLDLSKYFTIREYDPESKKFIEDNVSDVINNYAVLKFHYDENGAREASQSQFGMIELNRNYGETEVEIWQERIVYTLASDDLDFRFSETYNGYFVSLPADVKHIFNSMPRYKALVVLDLAASEKKIVGLDYNAFKGVVLDTVSILSVTACDFIIQEGALVDTGLTKLEHSSGITPVFNTGSINSEFLKVVIE